ncbi:MAG: serine/threonine protein kinase [Phycisphaerales bacterium]|nr:MAG: serine/threonine protein kinase [Phycisphaerales bacterium]
MHDKENDIETIYNAARQKPSGTERSAYLDKACCNDASLRSRVEALLKADEEAGSFLESPPFEATITIDKASMVEQPGDNIGPYKLLERIGEGGMAYVYMAEQREPIRRRVALKIIKLGMDTRQVIARFEAERQALAMMDHPNIAKVFDAGTTETGRPYFAMELVKGVIITEYCDNNKLNTRERLRLFIQVCNAVQHAHQKGIIHRDIKPTNVMVTLHDGKPVPKVIDFGIAKATSQRLTEKTVFTRYAQMIGTPEYMSPEQAEFSGLDIDTRSDIYSLGILLYELLTGATPFDGDQLRAKGYGEMQRIIRESEPLKPSTRLSTMGDALTDIADHRKTSPDLLAKLVRGDLDWIVMKTLEKDRTRRYEAVNALTKDIQRHLDNEPVEAGPPSTIYRIRKFIEKRRRTVAATATIAALLIIGLIATTTLYFTADRARNEAEHQAKISRAVSDFLRDDLLGSADPWRGRTQGTSVISFLDAASRQLEGKFADEPLIEASIRLTLGSTYWHLGHYKQAEKNLKRSLDIHRKQLGSEDFNTLLCMRELGWVNQHLGDSRQAESLLIEALDGMKRTLKEEDGTLLYCMGWLSWVYIDQGQYHQAERLQLEGLEVIRRKLGPEHPWIPSFMYSLGVIYKAQQRFDEAEKLITEALDISRRTRGDQGIETLNIISQLGDLYSTKGRYEDAERLLTEALEGRRKVYGLEHPDTFASMDAVGWFYRRNGKLQQAGQLLEQCYNKSRELLGSEHGVTLDSMLHLAVLRQDQAQYEQAEELMKEALRISRAKRGEDDNMTAWSLNTLGKFYEAIKKYDQAQTYLNEELEIKRRTLGGEHPDTLEAMGNGALLYYKRGKIDQAEVLGIETLQITRRALGEDSPITLRLMHALGWWYLSIGRATEAETLLTEALEGRRRILGENHHDTRISALAVDFQQGRYDKAEPLLVKVLEHQRRVDGPDEPFTLFSIRNLALLYHKQGRYDKAEPLLIEFLENSRRVLVDGHPDTVAVMNELTKLYEAWEKPLKAEEWRAKLRETQNR